MKMNKIVGLSLAMMLGFSVVGCNNVEIKKENGDEKFIKICSKAINERWIDNDELYEQLELEKITTSEYNNLTSKNIQEEVNKIEESLINIESKELKQLAENYVEGDKLQIKSWETEDGELAYKYSEQSDKLRKPSLVAFVEEYGMVIKEENQQTYKDFKEQAIIIEENNEGKDFLDKLATEVVIEKKSDEWGNIEYIVLFENTSKVSFKTVQYQVAFKDSEGIVVGSDWIYLENFDTNTKQKYTLYPYNIENIEEIILTTDYFEIKE